MATNNNVKGSNKGNKAAASKPTNAARIAAEKLAAELAAAEAAQQAAEFAAIEAEKAEAERAALAATLVAAAVVAPATAGVVTKVSDDVFGNRVNSLRCRAINTAILKLAGPDGTASFSGRQITTMTLADDNVFNARHVAEHGTPVKAISNHVLSLVIKGYLLCDAETGRYTLAPKVIEAVKAGKAK